MKYYFLPNGGETRFELVAYNPKRNEVRCAGPVGEFIVSLELDPTKELDCRLITEDGENAEFKRVQEELRAGVQDREEEGRGWYGL